MLSFVFSLVTLFLIWVYLTDGKAYIGDTFFHLLISKYIREHKWKYPSSIENLTFIESEKKYNYLAYPPLLHYITAVFPVHFQLKVSKVFNLVVLSLLSALTATIVYSLTANIFIALFANFIVIFNFSVFELVAMWSPRPLGLFFYSLVILGAIFSQVSLVSILVVSILITLVILTHKFALQVLVFGLLPYAIIFDRPYLFLTFGLGLLLSIIVSKGTYLKILKEHMSWLSFYSHHPSQERITRKLMRIVTKNFWIIATLAFLIILLFKSNLNQSMAGLVPNIIYWAFVPIVIALFVSIPNLSFLGEEYRYIEYSIAPIGILASIFFANTSIPVWSILLVSAFCILVSSIAMFKYKDYLLKSGSLFDPGNISSYNSLANYNITNLLVFPHIRTLEVRYFTNLHLVHQVRKASGSNSNSQYLENILNKGNVDFVLNFKGSDRWQLFSLLLDTWNVTEIGAFKNFELYKILSKK